MAEAAYLPEGVIHLIMSYLRYPERATVGAVSKDWCNAWKTYPKLELHHSSFRKSSLFQNYVEKALARYEQGNLHKLCLHEYDCDSASFLNNQVLMAANKGVKAIKIVANTNISLLPERFLEAKSLRDLSLKYCKFEKGKFSSRNSIRSLRLRYVDIDDEMLANFISSCPRMESLEIASCRGLTTIKVDKCCCPMLKELRILVSLQSLTIEVDAPSLEILRVGHIDLLQNILELRASSKLKVLELSKLPITETLFENFSTKFPNLECLTVKECYGYKRIHLTSYSLKKMDLSCHGQEGFKGVEIEIHSPNLIKFDYGCITDFKDQFLKGVFSDQCESCIRVRFNWTRGENEIWFSALRSVVANLSPSSKVTLELNCAMWIDEKNMGGSIPACAAASAVEIGALRLDVNFGSAKETLMFLRCLFWACRPKIIIQTDRCPKFCHLLYHMLTENHKMSQVPVEFWGNDIKKLQVKTFDQIGKEFISKGDTLTNSSKIIYTIEWGANSAFGEDQNQQRS